MEFLRPTLLFVHFLGLAALLGGCFVQARAQERRITPVILYGALVELVSGPLLIAVDGALDVSVNEPKAGVKLLVLLVITVLVFVFRKRLPVPPSVFFTLLGLCLLNVGVAVFWT
jgi:hypothetical protein